MHTDFYQEFKAIKEQFSFWWTLGNEDVKRHYRRTTLGPLWISLNTALHLCLVGVLYGKLLKIHAGHYIPHFASGLICWSLLSKLVMDSAKSFTEAETYLTSRACNLSPFAMRIFTRNLIAFFHNLAVFIPIAFIYKITPGVNTLFLIPGLCVLALNCLFWGTLIALFCTRYRDAFQIVTNLLHLAFFVTPVIWTANMLPEKLRFIVDYNPLNQLLILIRHSFTNTPISLHTIWFTTLLTSAGFMLYAACLKRYKHQLAYWL